MRPSRSTLLRLGAVAALVLLALATTPHSHDEAEGRDDTCVLCHVQASPPVASNVHDDLDPAVGGSVLSDAQGHARTAETEARGSRAPPA